MPADHPADAPFEKLRQRIAAARAQPEIANGGRPARAAATLPMTIAQAAKLARIGEKLPPLGHLNPLRRLFALVTGRVMLYFLRLVTIDQGRFNELVVSGLRDLEGDARRQRAKRRRLSADLDRLQPELRDQIDHLGLERREEIDRLRAELRDDIERLRLERRDEIDRQHLELGDRDRRLDALHDGLAAHEGRLDGLHDALAAREGRLDALHDALAAREGRLDALHDALAAREGRLDALAEALAGGQVRLEELRDALAARDRRVDSLSNLATAIADLRAGATAMRTQIEILQRRAAAAAPAGAADLPGPAAAAPPPPVAFSPLLWAEQLRDSEQGLGVRQETYVQHFVGRRDVLDVGCGRGEFLERLGAAGVPARGVDADLDMVLRCREKGLDATTADAIAYLTALPNGSLGGLFCAQVVEHLQTRVLVELIRQAARTLEPGAPLVIETLNPESLLVLYRWFWMDITHERLVHPETLMLLLRAQGFASVRCEFVPPPPGPLRLPVLTFPHDPPPELEQFNAATQHLNEVLYSSFDYAVIAAR